ncbi:hypothetical protein [Caballeronia sp. LZ034LL]|uniref:DUF3846 domain-containing protein n=1 Tax=Caballeronia sp. LZ034LL TaxID=3038567 RepID=UPI0028603982|nr:hypothetical protein [Caballeronia sp. LZ034LL]MDR5839367.1 hypothetical protein [Caballeronia sp. LZ034LL]
MKAFFIHPFAKTVTEVQHTGELKDIYVTLGCNVIDAVRLLNGDAIFIDDEGLLKPIDPNSFWRVPSLHPESVYTGRGLVMGSDRTGAPKNEPAISLEEMQRLIQFLSPDELLEYIGE